MSATLAGTANCGYAANVVVRLFTPGTHTEVAKFIRASNASGNFTITGITPGTYDVGAKPDGTLSSLAVNQVFTEGATTNIDFGAQYPGDVNMDDSVGAWDSAVVLGDYGLKGACYGYGGNWLMPDWPTAAGGGGASYKLIGGQNI